MKEMLSQYAAYNCWANERLLQVVLSLPEEKQQQEVKSSFGSLYATFLHLWNAESIWWQRLKMQEQIILPGEVSHPSMQEVANGLLSQSRQLEEWVGQSAEAMLLHVIAYYTTKKEYCKNPVWQLLLQVFNHGSYHRGQVVTILHEVGI